MEKKLINLVVAVLIGALIGHGLSLAGVDLFAWAKEPAAESYDEKRNRDEMLKGCYALKGEVSYTFYAKTAEREQSEKWTCVLP